MFQDPKTGIWWSDDRKPYNRGNGWEKVVTGSSTSTTATTMTSPRQQPQLQRQHFPQGTSQSAASGTPLGSAGPQDLAAVMGNAFGHTSQVYRQPQPPNGVFGSSKQTPGAPAVPSVQLDQKFRDAASRDGMIHAFVKAHDKMSSGQGS